MREGWQLLTIGEVCQLANGGTPKSDVSEFWGGNLHWITPAEMGKRQDPFVSSTQRTISELGLQNSSARMIPQNSVILSSRAPIGHLVINTVPMAFNQGCKGLIPKSSIQYKFLYYYLLGNVEYLDSLGTGATFKELSSGKLQEVNVPVPPLPEQRRIVALLDEAFAGLATAKANAERNLQNARALFESQLEAVFSQRGQEWMEVKFEDLIQSNVIGLTKAKCDQGDGKAWPYVKMNNITSDSRFDASRFAYVDATEEEVGKYSLRDGDFLFNTRNSHELVGKSCIYKSASNVTALFNNNIMRVRFKAGADAGFVLLAFSSRCVSDKLNSLKSGTTNVSAIYFKDLKSLAIPIPSVEVQKAIAKKFEALSEEAQRLTQIYERKLAALEELKKSLLQQAFNGEL